MHYQDFFITELCQKNARACFDIFQSLDSPDLPQWSEEDFEAILLLSSLYANGIYYRPSYNLIGCILSQYVYEDAEILNFAIHPLYQKRGLGSFLLAHHIKKLQERSVYNIFLDVSLLNDRALKLYYSFSFSPLHIRPNYYRSQENTYDALSMRLHLKNDVSHL